MPKSEGGLGFRNFVEYNQTLLANQAWKILKNPTSLLPHFLQARYFINSSILEAKDRNGPSLTCRSIYWGKNY